MGLGVRQVAQRARMLKAFRVGGINIFDRFNREAGVAGTIGYYCGLVAAFQLRAPQLADARLVPLIAELARTVSAIEHETGVAQLEGCQPLGDVALDHLPLPAGLLRAALADLHHRAQTGGLDTRAVEAVVGTIDVGLFSGQVGMR